LIDIEERVEVDGSPDRVWAIVSDPAEVASCVTGCVLGDLRDDGGYDATIGIKFGGIRVRFRTVVEVDADDLTHTGQMRVRGADQQGSTRINGTGTFAVVAVGTGRSAVNITGQVNIAGRLSGLITTGASVVVSRMAKEFAANLASRITQSPVEHGAAQTGPSLVEHTTTPAQSPAAPKARPAPASPTPTARGTASAHSSASATAPSPLDIRPPSGPTSAEADPGASRPSWLRRLGNGIRWLFRRFHHPDKSTPKGRR